MTLDVIFSGVIYEAQVAVRRYAPDQLRFSGYLAYGSDNWVATAIMPWHQCPCRSSIALINAYLELTGEPVDLRDWRANYPEHGSGADKVPGDKAASEIVLFTSNRSPPSGLAMVSIVMSRLCGTVSAKTAELD